MSEKKRGKKSKKGYKSKAIVTNPNEPFVLTYDSRQYSRWCACMAIKAKMEYGPLGQICVTGTLPHIPHIDPDDYDLEDLSQLTRQISKDMMKADISERQKTVARMKADGPKLYSLLLQYLSPESLAQVMEHDTFDPDEDVDDPVKLWNAIKLTHRTGADAVNGTEQRTQTRNALSTCQQGLDEALHQFYKRWKETYDTYKDAGNAKLSEADQASSFLNSLNNVAYGAVKAEYHNDVVRGIKVPKTVSEVYHYAAKFVVPRNKTKSSYGAAFTTVSKAQNESLNKKGSKGGRISSTEKRLRALEEKLRADYTALVGKEKPGGNHSTEKSATTVASSLPSATGGSKGNRRRPGPCWECGERGHIAIDCPDRLDSDEGSDESSSDDEDS
jgi:cation transport regulator ChaB